MRVKEFVPSAKADSDNKGQGGDAGLKVRCTCKRAADDAELKLSCTGRGLS